MIYYYLKNKDDLSIGNSSEDKISPLIIDYATEISKDEYNRIMSVFTPNKLLWQDKKGLLQVRNKLTKYNEHNDTWVSDIEISTI